LIVHDNLDIRVLFLGGFLKHMFRHISSFLKDVATPALSITLLLLFTSAARGSEEAQTGFNLPVPNGCHPVGTRAFALSDRHRGRELAIAMWYPAVEGKAAFAPYMDERTADAVAENWNLQLDFAHQVHTHGRIEAPIAEGGPFPIVLLEHGSGTVPAIYTVLAEGLASTGFIVVAPNHPPDSLIAVFPDRHEARFTPYWPAEADRRTQGVAIGKFAEDVLVPDVQFVIDQLQEMNLHDDFWHGHMNLSKVGIVGHSMGGTTAALATKKEPRILAGVNLDGSTFPGMNDDVRPVEVHKPLLFMATEEHASNPETRAREYVGSESNTYYAVMAGADHMSFTDMHLLDSRFSRKSPPDQNAFEHAVLTIQLIRSLIEEFFDKYLKGKPAPLLDLNLQIEKK
jgi:predicted dienelactone hydrolase